jgi:replicative DNA helicase
MTEQHPNAPKPDDTSMIREKPRNVDAERALLGSVLLDQRTITETGTIVTASQFWRESHRVIWATMLELVEEDTDIDVITLGEKLDAKGKLEKAGGPNMLVRLSNEVPSSANAKQYARIVREHYMRRQMIDECEIVSSGLYETDGIDSDVAADRLSKLCQRVTRGLVGDDDPSIKRHTQDWFERLEKLSRSETASGFPTGIVPIDELLGGGLQMQRLTSIAALPKMGKSKLAFSIMGQLVLEHGFAADVWYTDGPGYAIPREMATWSGTKLSTGELENPRVLDEFQWAQLTKEVGTIKGLDVNVYDKGTPHIRDIPLLVVVDYLQNTTAGHKGSSAERLNISDASRTLAALRTDHPNLTIIALMQFNRSAAERAIPSPHDLHGSSQLEKDLDHLLILHRPAELDDDAGEDEKRRGIIWHAMTKHGATGKRFMYCDLGKNNFAGPENRYD